MATDKIQFVDLQTQYQNLKAGIDAAIVKICARGDFILDEDVKLLETIIAIHATGAKPVLVDYDLQFYTIDPAAVERAITPRTKAIIPVHP